MIAPTMSVAAAAIKIGQVAAEIHPRSDHVEYEEREKRVLREAGKVQEQRQGREIQEDLQEDVPLDAVRGDRHASARYT